MPLSVQHHARGKRATVKAPAFERVRASVDRFDFPQVGRVTGSVEFTATVPSVAPSNAFFRADEALHCVKEDGPNQDSKGLQTKSW